MGDPLTAQGFDAFDLMPDPAVIMADDGVLMRANPAFRSVFRQWIGPQRPPWGRVQPPPFEGDTRRFEAAAPDGRRFEWVERRLAGGVHLAIARDITRHVNAAEEALRAKTTLFATLTHELRTPLNGILGMAGLLALGKLEPNERSYTDAIRQSGELLLDLITEILDYSRLDTGRIVLEAAPFDPEGAMQDVAELLSPKAHAKGLEIVVVPRGGAPGRVLGDDGRLRQILFNLAGNAVKFTDAGGVVLEMAPRPGGRLRFNVRDTGPGVAPDKQTAIFEEFAQADASIARRHGGAGLGLAIVKKLAQAMGGEVGLVSKPGIGANFWVELPLAAVEGESLQPKLTNIHIAVVSKSPLLTQGFRGIITSLGAIAVEPEERPDVLLFDWRADVSGEEAEALRMSARAVIALIPQEERDVIAQCRALGFEHYSLKPVRRGSLAERIRVALGEADAATTIVQAQAGAGGPRALAGLRVLVAEDNPINALLARTLLTRAGCVVSTVQDGDEAVAAAAAAPYDLIFLDIRMPSCDGYCAAERIRSGRGPSAAAPIIALTADASDQDRARALLAGMDDFLTKPIDAARLLDVAARFTDRANEASFDAS
jgi:signal transduction histidine kinase/DNA-binding response OmpR family regulator